jgi:pimeloyl-ACP methyl ester carboxylesterase
MADDAAAVLRHLEIARTHALGASLGGTIAMELALRHPRLVRSLTLACTWAEADARYLRTIDSWIALAYRVPFEERPRHVSVLPGGHGFFLEHAEIFNRAAALRFLKSVRSK